MMGAAPLDRRTRAARGLMRASCVAVAGLTLSSAGGGSAQNEPPVAMLDHVALYVQDLERSARFYREVFQLAQIEAPVPRARWLVLAHGTTLHLVEGRTAPVANER